jgi:hypothetical protein
LLRVNFFEWQLHILFIIVIVQVVAPIVHRQKVGETYVLIQRFVLCEMDDQKRQPKYLTQRGGIQYQKTDQDM